MATAPEPAILLPAALRKPKGGGPSEVLFTERQEIFTLPETKAASGVAERIQVAARKGLPLRVSFSGRRGVVQTVEELGPREVEEFVRRRPALKEPDEVVALDLDSIDPTTFNIVEHHLNPATFRLCQRTVPNYKKAKEIFDFCAAQSCHLGSATISPCIPFQYVRDGCYARAHKMRWIISTQYRYCCDKVFSFANQGNDSLAVQANKWGGCCVTWWYHVAPLIRVTVRLGTFSVQLALVIDPGMFDKPVLLSSWLAAQKNGLCSPNANVSMYSIQPGTAYAPANYTGTAFSTDPSYTSTDATLIAYSGLTTCP